MGEYLAFALEHSPQTRAAFERWRAARFGISRAGRLPEPSLTFGYYLRSVETRVGPQQYKLGVSQSFPWPTKLSAGRDAAGERAEAAARMVDAHVLAVRRDVAEAYWTLWLIHEEERLSSEHDAVIEALAGAVRGRLQTGSATLADLNQVDLNIARHHDHRGQHAEAAHRASARLRAILGAAAASEMLRTTDQPSDGLPSKTEVELTSLSGRHPLIQKSIHLAASEDHRARAQGADRFPRFNLGLSLIGTGDASMPGVSESGKDALVVSAGLSLPLWFGSYSDAVDSAEASSRSHRAMGEASQREAEAKLATALSNLRDAQRRIVLNKNTLVPQAESTFQAVLGGYQTGRSTVASVIIAQRDLIELQLEHARARAEHAKTWALLEFIVGMELDVGGNKS
jgi:outer membrane protein TolC